MQNITIELTRTGKLSSQPQKVANELIKRGLARLATRDLDAEVSTEEISPRTGKPKRQYRRRDMKAEQ